MILCTPPSPGRLPRLAALVCIMTVIWVGRQYCTARWLEAFRRRSPRWPIVSVDAAPSWGRMTTTRPLNGARGGPGVGQGSEGYWNSRTTPKTTGHPLAKENTAVGGGKRQNIQVHPKKEELEFENS